MEGSVPPTPSGSDHAQQGRKTGRRMADSRFMWVSSSPSPTKVAELESSFPEVIQVPPAALEDEVSCLAKHAILARSIIRWIPSDAIIREFRKAGVAGEVGAVCLVHRCYLFRFSDPGAKDLVLRRPWVVNGQPLATAEWEAQFIPAPNSLATALLWLRLPNLPIEFWNEDILRTILAPAGQYIASDAPTKEKLRGGFARACVRVDLARPLRPGARVRGNQAPFWQPFVYEYMEGICPKCGSIHLHGTCERSANAESSSTRSSFGPWMAALRRRRPPNGQDSDLRRKTPEVSNIPGTAPCSAFGDGWLLPTKTARRRLPKSSHAQGSPVSVTFNVPAGGSESVPVEGRVPAASLASPLSASHVMVKARALVGSPDSYSGGNSNGLKEGMLVDCAGMGERAVPFDVPVSVARAETVSGTVTQSGNVKPLELLNAKLSSDNPFAILDTDKWAGRPIVRKDANPGPSKRARPAEAKTQRVISKHEKRKGKTILSGSATTQDNFTFSIAQDSSMGSVTQSDKDTQTKCKSAQSTQMEGRGHDSVVSSLKEAILRNKEDSLVAAPSSRMTESEVTMEDSRSEECSLQMSDGGNLSKGYTPDSDMVEDPGRSQPHPTIK